VLFFLLACMQYLFKNCNDVVAYGNGIISGFKRKDFIFNGLIIEEICFTTGCNNKEIIVKLPGCGY
jgi:hypothetical protein